MKQLIFEKVRIEKAVAEGQCIAYADGKTIFVAHAAPGDIADVRIIKKQKGILFGKITQLHEPGPDRIKPRCEHFGICGGCKWQHVDYRAQLDFKAKQVRENFDKIGKLDYPEPLPILGPDNQFNYRNRLDFGFTKQRFLLEAEMGSDNPGPLEGLGFHVPGRFDKILDVKSCHLQDDLMNSIRLFAKQLALDFDFTFYDLKNHGGVMRSLIIRNSSLGEWMVIVAFGEENERISEYLEALKNQFPQITSLMYAINTKKNDTLYDQEILCYHGKDHILEKIGDLTFKVGPKSFFQTNSAQAEVLYNTARDFADLQGDELVYDMYTGTGSIALYVAEKAKKVVGVEYVEMAIEDAWINARHNKIENVQFYAGDMKDMLTDEFVAKEGKPDVIITDPPRAGMHPDVVAMLLRLQAPKIVYVSCNPATQARDLALMKDVYQIDKVQPVDMFPHTHHVENVVLLTLKHAG
ncbi:MAG: 23S rRNA (uracil(1939)-C(5))-methyltransferase RlmD [Bacteroidota bacterium]|nr:23S rRNA (uracil(1939)-C(5))-methyltransferase RlmD [Bacteroidota bacterium]MDX5430131.1 23S rRNA (uracil(1939)-C(5))-methyltransferase RlmD [Bacteroidota bacterium]MDX5468892.1 23S rRNA (uracil(1939)-C(5))-methyltransferase RlmD [Bacteroidota bacterium]